MGVADTQLISSLLELSPKPGTSCLVVSDVHLGPKYHSQLTEQYLIDSIKELGRKPSAYLFLNGDIFELWKYPGKLSDIISNYSELTTAIRNFAKSKGHRVIFLVGNHDDVLGYDKSAQQLLVRSLNTELCLAVDIAYRGRVIHVEHGHQFDPYNRLERPMQAGQITKGQKIVQSTLPRLHRHFPNLADGLDDVVDRRLLPVFVLSRFGYRIYWPLIAPIAWLAILTEAYLLRSASFAFWGTTLIVICWLVLWLAVLLVPHLIQRIFGAGGDIDEHQIDSYLKKSKYDGLIIGHTHRGMVLPTQRGWYANSGCNDPVQLRTKSWLGITLFQHYTQNSQLQLYFDTHIDLRYKQSRRPIIDMHRLEKLCQMRIPVESQYDQHERFDTIT